MKVMVALALAVTASVAWAGPAPQKRQAPIDIECAVPQGLKPGAELTAKVVLVPGVGADRLDVQLTADGALTIVEKPARLSFAGVKEGERVTVDVKVRLTGDVGRLGVVATLVQGGAENSKALMFVFGDPKAPGGSVN